MLIDNGCVYVLVAGEDRLIFKTDDDLIEYLIEEIQEQHRLAEREIYQWFADNKVLQLTFNDGWEMDHVTPTIVFTLLDQV